MKKIWGKRIGTGVLAISLMLSSLPTQLSIALPHKAKAADTEFKSEAFDYGKLPDSTAAKITRKSLTGREWTGEDNNLDITSVNTLPYMSVPKIMQETSRRITSYLPEKDRTGI